MSFITKRERVFHDLELCDLPPRNEGKLKAYASCTDARAWSHFGSSKTEHLTELIKRNNDLSKPTKYVPTTVIVDTLTASKNLEIARLKRKIGEFEQMLAVYEELELDCAQKCEIAKAHAAIKAANRDLDDMCLNLDISTYTDGMETESFETGKSRSVQYSGNWSIKSKGGESDRSRGDAWTVMLDKDLMSQSNQTSLVCPCDACVSVEDPRIDEMKEQIISKDAKLNAMRNSLAIMENDICEPFGIYAHIYTALEKIYGVLSQNSKYKQYLNLMTAGKDTRCVDIKAKILFKMKVLEKFCLALIAPCSKEFRCTNAQDCSCFYADISTRIENTYRITPTESTSLESIKRSQLVADIMEHEEMKEILSKESTPNASDDPEPEKIDIALSINQENQKRLKDLQDCYDDLLNCYENLKHETDCIRIRCAKYEELELELERLRAQLNEYNSLWNEKEHYRKRSDDLDSLKQEYMVLAEESSGLETRLKAESEINSIKANAIDELRMQNMSLEKRLNEIYISFEKDKSNLQCQLQESECKCMCQAQQIKSLQSQINQILERQSENIPREDTLNKTMEENESLKEQLKQYQDIEYEFQDKTLRVNELENEIARWRAEYEKLAEHNKILQDYVDGYDKEKEILETENKALLDVIRERSDAVENLMGVVKNKSLEIQKLTEENQNANNQLEKLSVKYENQLHLSRQESQELLRKVKDYDEFVSKQEDLSNAIEGKMQEYESLKRLLKQKNEENEKLKSKLNTLQQADVQNKKSIELTKKESSMLERKLSELEDISQQFEHLKDAFDKLSTEKQGLEGELRKKASQLESAIYSVKLNKKESGELLKQSESIKDELTKLHADNDSLKDELNSLREENKDLKNKYARMSLLEKELSDLKKFMDDLINEKEGLEHSFKIKDQDLHHIYGLLESKIEENQALNNKLNTLESHHLETNNNLRSLENENELHQTELNKYKRESSDLLEKIQHYKKLENEYHDLLNDHKSTKLEKEKLEKELKALLLELQKLQGEKAELLGTTDDLLARNNDLEKKLIATRDELLAAQSSPPENIPYANLMEEIQKLRMEKTDGQDKIRNLLNRLDEADQVILNFENEMHARDNKIASMQNHINNLDDEVQRLHPLLDKALNAGYDMNTTSNSIEDSRKQIEAHHSKASHNMKLELAMLQRSKSKLEDQLLTTKSQYESSFKDKQKYLSTINDLQNDRDIIVTDIKQLEIFSVGDSALTPDHCEVEVVLHSIDRIRKAFEAKHAKTVSLDQTLAKVQNSSQLFLNKADEAKKQFGHEKQKLLSEKEDAIKGKVYLEKQLSDIKEQLKMQISQDQDIIKDLQAEISNQKLIIDKINDSTKTYIAKLEKETQHLNDLYQNALSKIKELQENLDKVTTEKHDKEGVIQKLIADFENKAKEISELKSKFADLSRRDADEAQHKVSKQCKDVSSQTDNVQHHTLLDLPGTMSTDQIGDDEILKNSKLQHVDSIEPMYDILPKQKHPSVNEVQILAAKVEPTFDFVRSSYLNYKLKRLGPGQLEHYSFPGLSTGANSYSQELPQASNTVPPFDKSPKSQNTKTHSSTEDLIDIYRSPSDDIQSSSKMIGINIQKQSKAPYEQKRDIERPKVEDYRNVYAPIEPVRNYSDSQTLAKPRNEKQFREQHQKQDFSLPKDKKRESIIKIRDDRSSLLGNKSHDKVGNNSKSTVKFGTDQPIYLGEPETFKAKPKLNINLPRVGVESNSLVTATETDNNSLDSYTLDIYTHPIKETISDTTVLMPSSGEYNSKSGTPSLPAISNADDIYVKSRSFIELPSKDSSYTKSSSQSENKSPNDKRYDSPVRFNIFGDRSRVSEPQKIFSLVEKIQKFDPRADTADRRLSQDSLNRSDDSKNLPYVTDLKRRGSASKTAENLYGETAPEDGFAPSDNIKIKPKRPLKNLDEVGRDHRDVNKKSQTKVSPSHNIRPKDLNSGIDYSIKDKKRRDKADPSLKVFKSNYNLPDDNSVSMVQERRSDFALTYIMDAFKSEHGDLPVNNLGSSQSDERYANARIQSWIGLEDTTTDDNKNRPKLLDQGVTANLDTSTRYYEDVIATLRKSLIEAEKDQKMQMDMIKVQYDTNINRIINEHNQGVMNIQVLHEETLRDVMRVHENEVESLRSMSIDAVRKAEKLERECTCLKAKISIDGSLIEEVSTKCAGFLEVRKPSNKPHSDTKVLTKTNVEAFNVKPKVRVHGPCTCSLDINISDTIRNIFEQVDVEQRKMAEITYLKYIASKISNGQIEALDTQELSFLHLKVCRTWKQKLNKEETLQKKIDSLEVELMKKQRNAQQHMAELDRKVAREKRRLEEVREAVCRSTPVTLPEVKQSPTRNIENRCSCTCDIERQEVTERRSAGDLATSAIGIIRMKKKEHRGAVLRMDTEEKRDRRLYTDEPPTRLRRQHDRPTRSSKK